MMRSPSPQMTWVGTLTRCSHRSSRGLKKRGCHPKRALAIRLRMARSAILVGSGALGGLLSDARIGEGESRLLLGIDHENIRFRHALDVNAGGGNQAQAAQPLGRANCDFERDPAAERLAYDVHAGEPEHLDGVEVEIGKIGNVIDPTRHLGGAETGMVGCNHVEISAPTGRGRPAIPRAHPFRAGRSTARPRRRAED